MSDEKPRLEALRSDPHLGPVVERQRPVTLDPAEDLFERLVVSLIRQQVSMEAAARFDDAEYDRAFFEGLSDEDVRAKLTEIRGVGPWTAKMFLLFALGREDVFPVEDLGIRKGMCALYDDSMTRAEMVERAADWPPYRSYASLYLWRVADS